MLADRISQLPQRFQLRSRFLQFGLDEVVTIGVAH